MPEVNLVNVDRTVKVFWSWQDDSPKKTNRQFIKSSLEEAIKSVQGAFEFEDAERPELDHDTKGVAGAAEIVPELMAKIAASAIFVADVTPIIETEGGKALPNPNVMVELGWSLHKPGPKRQIYVLNTADGWTIEGLPFDIRHRRVLTYSLSPTADNKTRERVHKGLTKALADAISINLSAHLEELAAETPVIGVKAIAEEPSLWAGAETGFRHQDSLGKDRWTEVTITAGPRAYLRIIPSGWKDRPPSVATIGRLHEQAPYQFSRYNSGDFGATKEGFVRYSITTERDQPRMTEDAVMYFEDTGEFWAIHGSCVWANASGEHLMDLTHVFKGWSTNLRRANWFLNQFGAFPTRRVEIGFTGFGDVRFPNGFKSGGQSARRDTLIFDRKGREWSEPEAQEAFLTEALARVFELFGHDRLPLTDAQRFLEANDPERRRRNPFE